MNRLWNIFSFNEDKPLIFTQLDFWLFFIVVMVIFGFLHKNKLMRSFYLTVVSVFFYFKTSGLFVILLLLSLALNYLFGQLVSDAKTDKRKKWVIGLGVFLNIAVLIYFKYAYFFTESFNSLFHTDFKIFNHISYWGNSFLDGNYFSVDKIILPVGISFFTFQSISYFIDIYRKEIEPVKNFFDYTFFVTFFPQLVAGPIVRARDFIPQINQPFQLNQQEFGWSVIQIVKGLIKKIILADYIAIHFIDKVMDAPDAYPGFVGIMAMWGYSLQIYGDFSGYTDIAIGLSKLMGFQLLANFKSPYKARNVADFWRRWHISLGSWFRDYLYIPLGGNKTGGIGTYLASFFIFVFLYFIIQWQELIYIYAGLILLYIIGIKLNKDFKKFVFRDLNLLIVMIIGGLWHGASENFVVWGGMNGVALVLYNYWKRFSPYEQNTHWLSTFWKIFITFNFITFTRIWFRLEDQGAALSFLNHIWSNFGFKWDVFVKVLWTFQSALWVILAGFVLHWIPQRTKEIVEEWFIYRPMPVQIVTVAVIVLMIYQAVSDTFKPFVYFQF